ncbi:MAG: diaminopimelate decarboxylase [Actinomycetota bacterium]
MSEAEGISHPWWTRPGLDVRGGRLFVAGRDAEAIAREHGTPVYAHDLVRVAEQARALRTAFDRARVDGRVRLALKAQHEPELLRFVRGLGEPGSPQSVGMDVCSPRELGWALEHGWRSDEISYTGTNLSERDLDVILAHPDVHLTVDLLTQIDRVGRRSRGRTIGIRVNPRGGSGFHSGGGTLYSGARPTKFGIFPEQLGEALDVARRHDLTIDTVHFHVGDGYLNDGLADFDDVVLRVAEMVVMLQGEGCPIVEVNTGGGMGVPQHAEDDPLDLDRWASILAEHLGPLGVAVGTEPGDFLVKECAINLSEVVTVEERDGSLFVGLDVGWNAMGERFIYHALLDMVLCRAADASPVRDVTISGHINEGDDVFAEDLPFPRVVEGDIVAAINVGSYNASMTSEHCLRPAAKSVFFTERV